MSVALVCVVNGRQYELYASDLFSSAFEFFGPDPVVAHFALPGRRGWPDATLYRYHVLLGQRRALEGFDYIYLCDADMRFEENVGEEILHRLVATQHPGFVSAKSAQYPYERRPESNACVEKGDGRFYYSGGFVGGRSVPFLSLAERIVKAVNGDARRGVTAVWHDESHLNRVLIDTPPRATLTPDYCHPDDDSGYLATWGMQYRRKLVALDKTPAERGAR